MDFLLLVIGVDCNAGVAVLSWFLRLAVTVFMW